MRKRKKSVYKVLTKEELSTFFKCVDDYKFKTIFMIAYGSGLRIGEIVNLHISDIDSKKMRIFVREGKGNKERYTILSKTSLEMLRTYWSKYRKPVKSDKIFLTELDEPMTVGVIRDRFRRYRRKAGLNEKVTMHTLRHCYATNLIENGATLIQVKELMGHSNIRSTMEYVHVANIDLGLESPLDVFMRGEEDGKNIENLEQDLEENGLKVGELKSKVDTKGIINKIRLKRADIAWMGIELKGTNAIVKVIKADEKPEIINEEDYCNIVSNKVGVITKINAQNGTANVKVGDTVNVGTTLINRVDGRKIHRN